MNIGSQIIFENGIISAQWLNASVKVSDLEMDLETISKIDPWAFNSPAFSETIVVTLYNLNASSFQKDIFSGLNSLKILKLYQLRSTQFARSWLAGVSTSLENLFVYGMHFGAYNLEGLTSGVEFTSLTMVSYSLYLSNTINENTFTGLVDVRNMDLSFCGIDSIGPRSFDSIAPTINVLKLNNNQLKHLPEGIFRMLLPNAFIRIYLAENPFDCSCGLVDFKRQLQTYAMNFVQIPRCVTPFYLYNTFIDATEDFCLNGSDPNEFYKFIRCDDNEATLKAIQRQEHQSRLVQNSNNSVMVLQLRYESEPLILVVVEVHHVSDELNRKVDCIFCKPISAYMWDKFHMMHLHMICVMNPLQVNTDY